MTKTKRIVVFNWQIATLGLPNAELEKVTLVQHSIKRSQTIKFIQYNIHDTKSYELPINFIVINLITGFRNSK